MLSFRSIRHISLSWEMGIRVLADAVMINIALIMGLSIRYITIFLSGSGQDHVNFYHQFLLRNYASVYASTSWLLTLICLIIFFLSGFYTYGRSYRSRYKALVILQAVSVGYLVSGFVLYILMGEGIQLFLGIDDLQIPRSAFLISWVLTYVLVSSSRLWSTIWRRVVNVENQNHSLQRNRKIEKVLVIGGAGYIGSSLLRRLLDRGYQVRLLDLLLYGTEPIAEVIDHPNLEIVREDFRQVDSAVEAMQGMDAVVHLGGIVGDPACALDERLTVEINAVATRMLAEIARSSGIERLIFASTCSVYGVGDEILSERSSLHPVSLYARSKLAAEQMLLRMVAPGFAPIILRFGTIYGLSGRIRFDLVVNLLTAKAIKDGQITIFGGDQWRPFVHVDDAARSILAVLEAPLAAVHGEIFNVGSNEQNYQIKSIGELIQQIIPTAEVINKGNDADARDYRVDFSKIRNTLNFTPQWTVEDGVQQVIKAIEDGKVLDYSDKRYSNVKFLTDEGASRLVKQTEMWMGAFLHGVVEEEHS